MLLNLYFLGEESLEFRGETFEVEPSSSEGVLAKYITCERDEARK